MAEISSWSAAVYQFRIGVTTARSAKMTSAPDTAAGGRAGTRVIEHYDCRRLTRARTADYTALLMEAITLFAKAD